MSTRLAAGRASTALAAGLAAALAGVAGPARAEGPESPPVPSLPLGLSWCQPRAEVDAAARGAVEDMEDVLEVGGAFEGQKGRFTLVLDYGRLTQIRFRMFDTDAAAGAMRASLDRSWGTPTTPGDTPVWAAADGTKVTLKRQSGHVFVVLNASPGRCAALGPQGPDGPTEAEKAGLDKTPVFSYDPYADDPLEGDTRAQELEAQKKAEEEAKRKAEEERRRSIKVDWDGNDDDPTAPKDPSEGKE